jgi:hypothetical protein
MSAGVAAGGGVVVNDDKSQVDQVPVSGTRIVDGTIVRCLKSEGDHPMTGAGGGQLVIGESTMMAERTGGTGVQPNAAIAVQAPKVDYWAIHAGYGARLDGKAPTVLKDKDGNELDVRKLRAEAAAARRLEMLNAEKKNLPESSVGITVSGKTVCLEESQDGSCLKSSLAPISKRKSRIGSKYSKIKGAALGGSGSETTKKL